MAKGRLLLTLRTGTGALPVNDGDITVSDEKGSIVFSEHLTAKDSGVSDTVTLDAPDEEISFDNESTRMPYSVFEATVRASGFYRMKISGIQIFPRILSNLPVDLIPLPDTEKPPEDFGVITLRIPGHILRNESSFESGNTFEPSSAKRLIAVPTVNIAAGVFIPESITVHLGAPDANAENVTVPFTDYIKNVASSEIYPTWPEQSLKANITAQISLTLNRVYTEWYRSRGYDFDITNSTAYDQAFVYGRNIFTEIADIVDNIFNAYVTRPARVEPLFASYCNGSTVTCAGLSQWGTVTLAEQGQGSDEILKFYYGDIEFRSTDDIRELTESYPGTPLSYGSSGEDVRIIQEQLNRVAVNYPAIPLNPVSTVYDTQTENAVRAFQHIFVLPETGITDKATWYRLSYVYTSVKRLSQITSEGQREAYNRQTYPGVPLRNGSEGLEVQEIQFYLQRISLFNPAVNSPKIDGIYGNATANAVISFQRSYGLALTGVVDETVWNAIVDVYNGTKDNIDEPNYGAETVAFPGYNISVGASGEDVLYIQSRLEEIRKLFPGIKESAPDGYFGNLTKAQVISFAAIFGYPQTGVIDEQLWNKINEIYSVVMQRCLFESDPASGTLPYPGTVYKTGSTGENVRYIQEKINTVYRALPYVGQLETDGIYGAKTKASIIALQRIFGLAQTGATDSATWQVLNSVYSAVTDGCLPVSTPRSENAFAQASGISGMNMREYKDYLRRQGVNVGFGPFFGMKTRREIKKHGGTRDNKK